MFMSVCVLACMCARVYLLFLYDCILVELIAIERLSKTPPP